MESHYERVRVICHKPKPLLSQSRSLCFYVLVLGRNFGKQMRALCDYCCHWPRQATMTPRIVGVRNRGNEWHGGFSAHVCVMQLACMLRYSAWPISRDAKGYSLTVKLYPLALPFRRWLATRDPKEYSCSTFILKASTRNLGSMR